MKLRTVMKKVLSVALTGAMAFSLAACGSKEKAEDSKGGDEKGVCKRGMNICLHWL